MNKYHSSTPGQWSMETHAYVMYPKWTGKYVPYSPGDEKPHLGGSNSHSRGN
jgi:hypothetical protein